MDPTLSIDAWNNFAMKSDPEAYERGSIRRSAAPVCYYMSYANNGDIFHFLECTYNFDALEVREAMVAVGAHTTAREFEHVLHSLKMPLPSSNRIDRAHLLLECWPSELDEYDMLSEEADKELLRVLRRHVEDHLDFYLTLA